MAGFNPDQYLAEKVTAPVSSGGGFNPDAYLSEKVAPKPAAPEISKTESFARGAAQGASMGFSDEITGGLEAMWEKAKGNPVEFGNLYKQYRDESRKNYDDAKKANPGTYTTGEIGAGVATAFVPGLNLAKGASIAKVAAQGALMGGASGAGYSNEENLGDVAIDAAKGAAVGGIVGGGMAKAGQALSKFSKAAPVPGPGAGPKLPLIGQKANAEEIKAAAKQLGVEVTDAQLLDDGFLQKLDSMLQQSPTLVGRARADIVKKGVAASEKVAEESLAGATNETASQVGEKVKSALASKIRAEKEPISQLYDRLRETTQHMELSPKSTEAISRNVGKLREGKLGPTKGMVQGLAEDIKSLKTVDDVKFLRTQIRQGLSPTASTAEKNAVAQIDRRLKALEESTVIRNAKNFAFQTDDKEAAKEIMNLVGDRKTADKMYSEFMGKLEDFSGVIKGGKVGSPEGFVQKLEAMPEEEITRRLFSKNNAKGLDFIKKNFPKEADDILSLEKSKLLQKHTKDGKVQTNGLLRDVKNYSPEVQEMLFGKEGVQKLKAARTYMESLPGKANPSETATTQEILSFWGSPVKAAGMTARDLLISGVLKSAKKLDNSKVESAFRGATKVKDAGANAISNVALFERRLRVAAVQGAIPDSYVPEIGNAADKNSPKKGPDKWANDGLEKLKEHDPQMLNRIPASALKDPKAKELLIKASDLKPGSKAMTDILERIEKAYGASSSRY